MQIADAPPITDLEARARWHLELGYWEDHEEELDERDDDDGEYMGRVTCWRCDEGTILDCCDDLCHGQGWCMHGRNRMCPNCCGEGFL